MDQAEEIRLLRACVRDLVTLSSLPLLWVGRSATEVLSSFVEILKVSLHLDLAYATLDDPNHERVISDARLGARAESAELTAEVARLLAPALSSLGPSSVASPIDGSTLHLSAIPMALDEQGVVVAGSRRADFPNDFDAMVLGSAINQLTIWLGSARASAEQFRAEATLAERDRLRAELEAENAYLREEMEDALSFGRIVGQSAALRDVLTQVDLVAPTEANVLLLGESGTGKELIAREIHERSRRAHRPLIKVNCSAIPREMFESEFFGHARGAFTGASRERQGRFQLADRGTLFLDEVADLPLDLQPKLLRVLQEGHYERVGEDATRHVDVRVIAATNRDLATEVEVGRFREDLYYRLSVFPIELPPLRARKEDIPALAQHFVTQAARRLGTEEPALRAQHHELLAELDWRGNVRELQNVIERAVILSRGGELRLDLVLGTRPSDRRGSTPPPPPSSTIVPEREWRRLEHANLLAAIERAGGRIYGHGGAAELLGMKPSTLQSRLRALRIRANHKS